MPELFSKSKLMGTFKGFSEKGFEFAAEIVAPYNSEMQDRPQLGQFLLIQLSTPEEASLGRITKFVPSGLLASAEGEDYVNTMQERETDVPEDLKKSKLKYRVQIKLLGAVKNIQKESDNGSIEKIVFVPSQRRLPHLGAKVALPSDEVLKELCQLNEGDTELGYYSLGEFIFSGNSEPEDSVLRHISPKLKVTFNIHNLVSKRSVVFARAGYGKSNLIKFLISELYRNGRPQTEQGNNTGVLIFDADGEYFWPDFKSRPGLCDVPQLKDNLVVFTERQNNKYYESWKVGGVRLDIRELPARDVIGIAIASDRQEQQNVLKLKGMNSDNWRNLVDLIMLEGLRASDEEVGGLLGYSEEQIPRNLGEIGAARSNMYGVVSSLHDPESKLLDGTLHALQDGLCVIIDISLLSSSGGYNVAGLIMRKIFSFNQDNFTGGASPIPVISIIEEAQSVLGKRLEETSPFVEWVKEGRKYDLGAVLVTQQPGSMAPEIMSQSDNWFSFHLLSEGDAAILGRYNSHFSHDILAHLIGEPIPGNCFMWSAPKQPFVLPVRIQSFEGQYENEVKKDGLDVIYSNSPALEVKKAIQEKLNKLADLLREKIISQKSRGLSTKLLEIDGIEYYGIYSGQLYHLIKDIKPSDELRTENQLMPMLTNILLEDNLQILEDDNDGRKYYAAEKRFWGNIID